MRGLLFYYKLRLPRDEECHYTVGVAGVRNNAKGYSGRMQVT
jgi:hypothetical protein